MTPHGAALFSLLERLLKLARAQRDALLRDDLAGFATLVNEREPLIAAIRKETEESAALAQLPSNVVPFPGRATVETDSNAAREALLHGILHLDRSSAALLAEKRQAMGAAMQTVQTGRRAVRGYAPPAEAKSQIERAS